MFGIVNDNKKNILDPQDLVSEYDIYSFSENNHYHIHKFLGTQVRYINEDKGLQFTIWAPFAKAISVAGNFNNWNTESHPLIKIHDSGIWSNWFLIDADEVEYQYAIHHLNGDVKYINDPFASQLNFSSRFCSVVQTSSKHKWSDAAWISARENNEFAHKAISILNFDLSTVEKIEGQTYQTIAKDLVEQAKKLGFTHIEIKNCIEELVDFSLQSADGINHKEHYYFAPNSTFGNSDDFKCLVDFCHKNNLAVIINLPYFSAESFPNINSYKLLDKKQYINYYLSNVIYWLEDFHIDGFNFGDVEFNINAKRLDLIKELFQTLTQTIHSRTNGAFTLIAACENYNQVTKPAYQNGLGINLKIFNDIIPEISDFISDEFQKTNCADLAIICANIFAENAVLRLENLINDKNSPEIMKIIAGLFFFLPSKKIVDYEFVAENPNQYLIEYCRDLNKLYTESKIFFGTDFKASCFEWNTNFNNKYISFIRWSKDYKDNCVVIINFSDEELLNLRVAVPDSGFYLQAINSDLQKYGGSGLDNEDGVYSSNTPEAGRDYSIVVDIAAKSLIVFKKQ